MMGSDRNENKYRQTINKESGPKDVVKNRTEEKFFKYNRDVIICH